MSDFSLHAEAPYAGVAVTGRFGDLTAGAGVRLETVTAQGLVGVIAGKGKAAALSAAAGAAFGCALPTSPHRVAGRGVAFAWAGPEQWLASIDAAGVGDAVAALAGPFEGLAALIDQSDARAVLRIGGAGARAGLAKGLPIDLHQRVFRPGDVALTSAAHIPVHLWQVDEAPTYEIAVPRSFAASFWHWLTQSCAEFGYEVAAADRS